MGEVVEQPRQDVATTSEAAAIMSVIAKAASDPNTDVVKLEKMLEMHERILNRNARMAFAAALAEMQQDIPSITENGAIVHREGEKPKSKYATFEDINDAVKPVLQKYGFAISFRIKQLDSMIEVTAILNHREGHSEETSMKMPSDNTGSKNAVQAMGSTVSYGKRYTMMAMLNITSRAAIDKDDDAASTDIIESVKAAEIDNLLRDVGADREKFLKFMAVDDVRKIKSKDYQKAINALNAKKQEKK